jgi:hypothetical protein
MLDYFTALLKARYRPENDSFLGQLKPPATDAADLLTQNPWIQPLQIMAWADQIGLFDSLNKRSKASSAVLACDTGLNVRGIEAFLDVLLALGMIARCAEDTYVLQPIAQDYLVSRKPFYVGFSLYQGFNKRPPHTLLQAQSPWQIWLQHPLGQQLYDKAVYLLRPLAFGRLRRLREQHSRNLAAGVAAAHRPEFDAPRSVVDIGGGSGTFAIPLAQRRADVSITLIELPRAVPHTRKFIRAYGVTDQVEVLGFDVVKQPQRIPPCNSIFIGNLIHDMGDCDCLSLFHGCYRALAAGDSMWIHERLWNDTRDGPLLTAQWHFIMMSHSRQGKQRTAGEVEALMTATGFTPGKRIETTSGFTLLEGIRNAGSDSTVLLI